MKPKKWILPLFLVMSFVMTACGPEAATPTTAPPTAAPPTEAPTAAATAAPTTAANKTIEIPVIVKTDTSTYWKIVGDGATEAGKAHPEAHVTFMGPDS